MPSRVDPPTFFMGQCCFFRDYTSLRRLNANLVLFGRLKAECIASFFLFTHHDVFRLVRLHDLLA